MKAAGERGEDQPVGVRTDMKIVDEDDRRTGHVDEQAGKRESAGNRIGIKLRADQDLVKAFQNSPRQQGDFRIRPDGLRAAAILITDHQQDREGREKDEDPGPADGGRDQAADRGSKQRRDAEHQHQQRQNFGALARRKEVAHHGNGTDLGDTAAERLQQSKGDEQFGRRHGDAAERRDGEQTSGPHRAAACVRSDRASGHRTIARAPSPIK